MHEKIGQRGFAYLLDAAFLRLLHEHLLVLTQHRHAARVVVRDDRLRLRVDKPRRPLGEGLVEGVVAILPERERPHRLRHAEDRHLLVRHVGHSLHVVLRGKT